MESFNQLYRHEYKYFTPETILKTLELRAENVLTKDKHAGERGFYHIRSMYFDDMYNTCYRENEDGTDPREKFRIRIYNNSDARINLELKKKQRTKCLKISAPLSRDFVEEILHGKIPELKDEMPFLVKKFITQMYARKLRPVNIVCYDRVPFVYKYGNVRVTFDRNIRSGSDFTRFFDDALPVRPVLPLGTNLLEVKWDEFIPDYIFDILQTGRLQQTSFSKYYLCRKYSMNGELFLGDK